MSIASRVRWCVVETMLPCEVIRSTVPATRPIEGYRIVLVAIVIASAALMLFFVVVAIAGNRAHDRQQVDLERRRSEQAQSARGNTTRASDD